MPDLTGDALRDALVEALADFHHRRTIESGGNCEHDDLADRADGTCTFTAGEAVDAIGAAIPGLGFTPLDEPASAEPPRSLLGLAADRQAVAEEMPPLGEPNWEGGLPVVREPVITVGNDPQHVEITYDYATALDTLASALIRAKPLTGLNGCLGCFRCRAGDHWSCHGCPCRCQHEGAPLAVCPPECDRDTAWARHCAAIEAAKVKPEAVSASP